MALPVDEIKKLIKESIPDASIEIKDLIKHHTASCPRKHSENTIKDLINNHFESIQVSKINQPII